MNIYQHAASKQIPTSLTMHFNSRLAGGASASCCCVRCADSVRSFGSGENLSTQIRVSSRVLFDLNSCAETIIGLVFFSIFDCEFVG